MNASVADRAKRSFSRSFRSYHDTASQQAGIAEALAQRLSTLGAPGQFSRAFEFGCGTGHLTQALLQRFSLSALTVNDLTPAARKTAAAAGAEFLEGDVRTIIWPEAPDLIASASTIQWLDAPEALVRKAAQALAPGGWLALSSFGPAQFSELHDLGSSAQAPGLRSPAVLADVIQTTDMCEFDIVEFGENWHKSWFETPNHVLRHLRETGVNATVSRVWTRAQLAQFCDAYRQTFGAAKGVPLTYHPTWVIARKCG